MNSVKLTSTLIILSLAMLAVIGCVPRERYEDLKLKNRTQEDIISELKSQLSTLQMQHGQLTGDLSKAEQLGTVDVQTLREELTALEKALESKNSLIEKMQAQLLRSGSPLPMELNILLNDFAAANSELVSFDESTGMLKFKSDLLFASGSDTVQPGGVKALEKFAAIAKSEQAANFDIMIAGHTDDVRIGKPSTRRNHPTNWHLSAHRAISVVKLLDKNGVKAERLSARGFGQIRPVAPNKPKNGGNAANRRVEIFIVPKGM
jgi:chemotaxis protein MotB